MTVLAAPLDKISREARPYPSFRLPEAGTGLCLFAAAFLGVNDAIHMARKDMTVTCVDVDRDRLSAMAELYPDTWRFEHADAWEYATLMRDSGAEWDAVSIDTFTGDASRRSTRTLDLWCSLATKIVTVTVGEHDEWAAPPGWEEWVYPRSDLAAWLVLERQ